MNSYEENIIIMNEQRDRMNRQRELPLRLSPFTPRSWREISQSKVTGKKSNWI